MKPAANLPMSADRTVTLLRIPLIPAVKHVMRNVKNEKPCCGNGCNQNHFLSESHFQLFASSALFLCAAENGQ
jgi:hypothetical protein